MLKETVKPFRLVKYFFLSSFIVIILFAVALTYIITQRSEEALLKKTEDFALLLAENLNHQVFFNFVLPTTIRVGKVQLRDPEQFKHLDQIVRNTIFSFKVEKVNIYDLLNVLAYSTDRTLVGKKNLGGTDFKKAAQGRHSSRYLSEDVFFKIRPWGGTPIRKLITTIPFRVESPTAKPTGQILGVFEITQNISTDYQEIIQDQYLMVLISMGLMALLYLILLFIVKRGDVIMAKRAEEEKRLVEKLNQAERMATLGEMIASVSHEIKNPLGIIRSTGELLEKRLSQYEPGNPLASVIREESDRLNRIVTEFLDFARPQIPHYQSIYLESVLEKNIQFLTPELDRLRITIQRDYSLPPSHPVQADQDLLYRAFLNILINAIQAMPEGGSIRMGIQFHPREVEVIVSDSGQGLSDKELDKAFQPFFTTKEKGSGLGLAIVKNIIEAHRGTIKMVTPKEGGTAVVILLPRENPAG
jgi:two-component system, NtrC family, sensor histidine kinase HydH